CQDPGGVTEISRWLSAAIPPETIAFNESTPEGSQQWLSGTPPGCSISWLGSGGFAALNHRLISVTPTGSNTKTSRTTLLFHFFLRRFLGRFLGLGGFFLVGQVAHDGGFQHLQPSVVIDLDDYLVFLFGDRNDGAVNAGRGY